MNRTVPVKKKRSIKRKDILIIILVILAFSIVTRLKSYSSYYDAESFSIEIPTGYGQVLESKMNNQEFVGYAESSSSNSIIVLSSRYSNKQSYKVYKQILDGALQKNITSPVFQDFNSLPIKDAYEDRLGGRKVIVINQENQDGMKQSTYVFATNKYIVIVSGSSQERSATKNIIENGVFYEVVKTLSIHDSTFDWALIPEVIIGVMIVGIVLRGLLTLSNKNESIGNDADGYAKKVKKTPESNYGYTPSYKINYDYKPPEDTEDKKY